MNVGRRSDRIAVREDNQWPPAGAAPDRIANVGDQGARLRGAAREADPPTLVDETYDAGPDRVRRSG
jgi:hypothetical protein